jgi:hypothetical protein
MFVVEFDNGAIVTTATHSWNDIGRFAREENRKIRQLILTDMYHFRETIIGADAYYYFTEAEARLINAAVEGSMMARPGEPSVYAEEIAGFYSMETACRHYEQNIGACDSNLVEIEKKLVELRATPITSDDVQQDINRRISDKLSLQNALKVKRQALMKERKVVIAAGGFIVAKRLLCQAAKFPLNIDGERYALSDSHILHQNPEYWIGSPIPIDKIVVNKTDVVWDEFVGNWVVCKSET